MNAVGLIDDVMTLLHEAGHAFHAFAAQPTAARLAATSSAPRRASWPRCRWSCWPRPISTQPVGYFAPEELRRARLEHLEDVLVTPGARRVGGRVPALDLHQPEGADAAARDAAWLRIRSRFEAGVDWSGWRRERIARWYRQLHIFLYPFYYIEYGIAQLGALQVWRNSLRDPARRSAGYRDALALGGTRPLPDIYAAAGARLAFDAGTDRRTGAAGGRSGGTPAGRRPGSCLKAAGGPELRLRAPGARFPALTDVTREDRSRLQPHVLTF